MHKEKKQNWYTNLRKYHFIYKTTCSVNGKFYYGMHSTDNLDDGYIGSGTQLWHSIKKHGIENFKLEILEFCPDREALKKREAELITEDMLQDQMCMNLALGGNGGYGNEAQKHAFTRAGQIAMMKTKDHSTCNRKSALTRKESDPDHLRNIQKKATEAAKNINSKMMWITNGTLNRKILKETVIPDGWNKGRSGNFVNKRYNKTFDRG